VVCQVDRLRRTFPVSIRSVLNDLPKTLDETYGRSLLDIDEEKREYAKRLFLCLTVSIRPLRVEELAEILAVRFNGTAIPMFSAAWRPENAEEAVTSACSSLIAIVDGEGSHVVQFSHFSVKEYLTSERLAIAEERLSYYHILPKPAHIILAQAGLSVLLQFDDKTDKDTIGHFPLASYAARYWVDHAQFRDVSLDIQEGIERLFDSAKPHFAAWLWLYDIDRHWIQPMSSKYPMQPEAVPLYYASLCGFRGIVEHLIAAHSPNINMRGGSHRTALHAASVKGHLEVASLLLENGADPNSRDDLGRAPLHRLSHGGPLVMAQSSLDVARLLINSGADVSVIDDEGETPLHAAARSGYRDVVELLLKSGASLGVRCIVQQTPLHVACIYGKLDVSRFLIDQGSDINSRDEIGFFPLHTASRFGHIDIARLLIDCGSDVNVRATNRSTPLHYVSMYGRLDLARLLIDCGADVNAYDAILWTPMHFAANAGHLNIAKLLTERGANIERQNDKGDTPLHRAARHGHLATAAFLIESGAAVSARNIQGWTPFHTASQSGHLHIAKFLLECGIDVDNPSESKETSLYLASSSGKLDVASFLIARRRYPHQRQQWSEYTAHRIAKRPPRRRAIVNQDRHRC
jgi:ankyrin repeat protein